MNIAEGQALQDQRDIEQQIQQDIRDTTGRKPRNETSGRRCGTCRKTGHNLRTCQMAVGTLSGDNGDED